MHGRRPRDRAGPVRTRALRRVRGPAREGELPDVPAGRGVDDEGVFLSFVYVLLAATALRAVTSRSCEVVSYSRATRGDENARAGRGEDARGGESPGGQVLAPRARRRCGSSRHGCCRSGACGGRSRPRRSRLRRSPGSTCTTCREASGAVREVSPRSTRREENARGSSGPPPPALPTRRASSARSMISWTDSSFRGVTGLYDRACAEIKSSGE